jgi:nitrate reductase assembly molybdenum cofactor insertion protein NarJ
LAKAETGAPASPARAGRSSATTPASATKPAAASPEARPAPGSATAAVALARAFVYRTLAQAFEYPSRESWTSLSSPENLLALEAASVALQNPGSEQAAVELCAQLPVGDGAAYHDDYVAVFGHAARGSVPMNEIEFGEPKADALFQPHRLADLAAFYRAYGLNMAADAGERQDHLCVELEFMSVLAAKEAYALDGQAGGDASAGLPGKSARLSARAPRPLGARLRPHADDAGGPGAAVGLRRAPAEVR